MTDEERVLARLEADFNEIETWLKRYESRRPAVVDLSGVEESLYRWLKQRSADISVQMQEMQRHTDLEDPPTSPAAYRRWINRNHMEDA